MEPKCPQCGAVGVDITLLDHSGPRVFLCSGTGIHEFIEGDILDEQPEPESPGLIGRSLTKLLSMFSKKEQ